MSYFELQQQPVIILMQLCPWYLSLCPCGNAYPELLKLPQFSVNLSKWLYTKCTLILIKYLSHQHLGRISISCQQIPHSHLTSSSPKSSSWRLQTTSIHLIQWQSYVLFLVSNSCLGYVFGFLNHYKLRLYGFQCLSQGMLYKYTWTNSLLYRWL